MLPPLGKPSARLHRHGPWHTCTGGSVEHGRRRRPCTPPVNQNPILALLSNSSLQIRANLWKPQWQRPYLFGGLARPACANCKRDTMWAHFCQYRSYGPICPAWIQQVGAAAPGAQVQPQACCLAGHGCGRSAACCCVRWLCWSGAAPVVNGRSSESSLSMPAACPGMSPPAPTHPAPAFRPQSILGSWAERGFELPLTLTPCDLWRHIRGRTLFMMGAWAPCRHAKLAAWAAYPEQQPWLASGQRPRTPTQAPHAMKYRAAQHLASCPPAPPPTHPTGRPPALPQVTR